MRYAKILDNKVVQVQPSKELGFMEVADDIVCGMIYDNATGTFSNPVHVPTQEEIVAHFKTLYMGIIDAKLKELDYDSLATVKLWEGDATFGAEATRILDWYKAIINKNYELLNAGTLLTDDEYLAHINGIVF